MENSAPSVGGGGGGGVAEACTIIVFAIVVSMSGKSHISHRDRSAYCGAVGSQGTLMCSVVGKSWCVVDIHITAKYR